MNHLSAQDEELLRQTHMIMHLLEANGIKPEQFIPQPTNMPTETNGQSRT
ncbi:MAG TPA: hypothetical protein VHV10_17455 [Ktedonobacteraceae bacterium]|jgi:hypothetical protein|nr:hypothetical protein [Ktedonobacteraceae bacterium]